MNKSIALIGILALVAISTLSLYFMNRARLVEQEAIMQEQMVLLMEEQERSERSSIEMREEQRVAAELAQQATEAKLMAEAQVEKERLEKQALIEQLNERLAQEAEDRRLAEAAQQELALKIAALEEAQAESKAALVALEAERVVDVPDTSSETTVLRQKMEAQEQQLVALAEENESLKEQQKVLEEKQIATEEAIVEAGGRIDIPYPEIRSPNARRREAIYFKERVIGHPNP